MFIRPWVPGLGGLRPVLVPRVVPSAPVQGGGWFSGLGRMGDGLPVSMSTISDGRLGTKQTIRKMGELAVAAGHDPKFVAFCRGQVSDLASKDYVGEGRRIFDMVHQHVRYVKDPMGLEVVQDPRAVLWQDGSGDCDEHASTIAACAIALGHHAAFRTVAANYEKDPETGKARRIDEWSHVYALIGLDDPEAEDGVSWFPADSTQRRAKFGWEPPDDRIWMKKDWLLF